MADEEQQRATKKHQQSQSSILSNRPFVYSYVENMYRHSIRDKKRIRPGIIVRRLLLKPRGKQNRLDYFIIPMLLGISVHTNQQKVTMMNQQEGSRKVRWICEEVRNDDDDADDFLNESDASFTSTVSGITLDTSFDESICSFHLSSSLRFPTTTLTLLEEEQESDALLPPMPPQRTPSYPLQPLHNDMDECKDNEPRQPSLPEEVDDIDSSFKFKPPHDASPEPAKKPLRLEQQILLPYMNGIDSSLKFKPGLDDVSPEPARKPVRRLSGGRVSRQRSRERQRCCGTRNFGFATAAPAKPARRRGRKADIVAEHAA